MRNTYTPAGKVVRPNAGARKYAGFTLIELLVAMAVFLVIGGAAMSLFKMHVSQFTDQQNQIGLNTSLRNALTQIEVDIANAGTGYYTTVDKASFPIGVTILSGGGAGCNAGQVYTAACFDTLNILSTDGATPPGHPDGPGNCTNTNTSAAALVALPPPQALNPATNAPWTAAQYAAQFNNGDQVLFASGLTGNFNTAALNGPGVVAGAEVSLPHQQTSAAGQGNSAVTDPLRFSAVNDPNLAVSFCNSTDWVIKLAPSIIYGVDTTNPNNPQLYKQVGALGARSFVADQIIGFRILSTVANCNLPMATWPAPPTIPTCVAPNAGTQTNYNQIRTLRVSLIGRTAPNQSVGNFRNTFDNGYYRVQEVSVTANPRNLSMND
jgi:prepilin-type N-terminal cleavage/methylation domain-containing protein